MGKKSRLGGGIKFKPAVAGPSSGCAMTSAIASVALSPAPASVQQQEAFDFDGGDDTGGTITERLGELLDSISARQVLTRLKAQGYSDHVSQRACLEVHQAKREVSYDSAIKWIRRHDINKIDKPLQPLELLKYLSEIVVSLVERLPKPEPVQLQPQITTELRGSQPLLISGASASSSGSCSSTAGTPWGASGTGASLAAAAARQHASQQALLLDPQWQASLTAEDEILTKLAAAEAAKIDLEAMLQELGALEDPLAATAAGSSSAAAAEASCSGSTIRAAAVGGGEAAAELGPSSRSSGDAAHAAVVAVALAAGDGAGSGSSAAVSSSFTGRVAQQVLGLQQQMSKAMQSLASLGRSSSGNSGRADAAAAAAVAEVDAAAGAAAGPSMPAPSGSSSTAAGPGAAVPLAAALPHLVVGLPAQQQLMLIQEQLSKQRQSDGQLASLRAMLGPGVEVYTADEYRDHNPGTDYESLPAIDLQLVGPPGSQPPAAASAVAASTAVLPLAQPLPPPPAGSSTEAAGAAPGPPASAVADEPQALAAELTSLRQHREWADLRIAQLIRRASDAERPVREEAARLLEEVKALRGEKEGMKLKLRELERSIAKIKESTYLEAAQKREYELAAAVAAAELEAASLRESEAAAEARDLQKQLAQERKKREAAEARSKKSASDAASSAAAVAAAMAQGEVEGLRRQLAHAQQLAEEWRSAVSTAEAAAVGVAGRASSAAASAKGKCEVLAAEKASLVVALEEADHNWQRVLAEVEQEQQVLREQLGVVRQHAEQLEALAQGLQHQLAHARGEAAAAAQHAAVAEARAATSSAAAKAAQQQLAAMPRQQQQQEQQARNRVPGGSIGGTSVLSSPALAMLAPSPSLSSMHRGSDGGSGGSLFGGGSLWGGGLFSGGPLDVPADRSLTPWAPPPLSGSMGSSSPLSQSGAATPRHSMSSIANSPVAPPPSQLLPGSLMINGGGGGGGGGGLFAPMPQPPGAAFPGPPDSTIGGGHGSMVLPDPYSIWGGGGAPAPGGGMQPQFFAPPQQVLP